MRERADRRTALLVGIVLAVTALSNDLVLTPPSFVERAVTAVADAVNRDTAPDPAPGGRRPSEERRPV